jgi:hypothetical protein
MKKAALALAFLLLITTLTSCAASTKEGEIVDTSMLMFGNADGNAVWRRAVDVKLGDGTTVSARIAEAVAVGGGATYTDEEDELWEKVTNSIGQKIKIKKNGDLWEFDSF